jgi:hypothetical protein
MAGLKGKSGPPGNMNAFKHGLAAIQKRREESISTEREESVRQQNSRRLDSDKSGDDQISTVTRILAEVIASDASWLMVFNGAIDHVIQNNPKARQNPRGLSQLDGYKRGLVNSLTGNLQKFGLDRVPRVRDDGRAQERARLHQSVLGDGFHGGSEEDRCADADHARRDDQIVPIGASAILSSKLVKDSTLKVYPGFDHGVCSTHKDQINADLLAFIKS